MDSNCSPCSGDLLVALRGSDAVDLPGCPRLGVWNPLVMCRFAISPVQFPRSRVLAAGRGAVDPLGSFCGPPCGAGAVGDHAEGGVSCLKEGVIDY